MVNVQLKITAWCYTVADFNGPWNLLEATEDCDDATSLFYDLVEAAIIDVVPVVRPRRPSPPWFDGQARFALRAKERAFRRKKSSPTPENIAFFQQSRTDFKKLVKIKYATYLRSITDDIGKNPKRFWSFIKAKRWEVFGVSTCR